MATPNVRPGMTGPALIPAPDPTRSDSEVEFRKEPFPVVPGGASGMDLGYMPPNSLVGLWTSRRHQWLQEFERIIAPNLRKYWHLWRNFDQGPTPGAGQEWRDRTVVPQAFKELSTRVPRLALGLWGVPESFAVRGRGYNDERYEEQVRVLIEEALDEIGLGDSQKELFIARMIVGMLYGQIIGHVWWKAWWRNETHWFKTKRPRLDPTTGKQAGWDPVEMMENVYDNVDIAWLPVTDLAVDVFGRPRRWSIEYYRTSLESLKSEDKRYREQAGRALYPGLVRLEDTTHQLGTYTDDRTSEPRDTEHWPSDDGGLYSHDPGETPVEMWLCWDNVQRTLTKIANRRVVLDHGISPTPDGLDPYIGQPAVPIPGRTYGDSIFNWTGPLNVRQTRISRARMDETLMNMFQQYVYREGALKNTVWFWRPGGGAPIEAPADRPITDSIYLVPRRPLPPEAYAEERYVQQQSESVAGADAVGQGVEATSKSRDVTAAEINQRVLQGANRFQLEVIFHEAVFKRPLLQKVFDLLRQNLTQPKMIRILDDMEAEQVDLTKLDRPIDIIINGTILEASLAEKLQELREFINIAKGDNAFAPWLKPRPMLIEMLRATRTLRRNTGRFVKSEEEMQSDIQKQQMAAMAAAGMAPPPGGASPTAKPPGNGQAGPVAAGAQTAQPGPGGLANASGTSPGGAPPPAGGAAEEI